MARRTRPFRVEQLEDRLTPTDAILPTFLPDPAFGTNGTTFATPDLGPFFGTVQDAERADDGKVWVLGTVGNNAVVARFTADGKLDTSFDGDGLKAITPWRESMNGLSLTKLALRSDGRVLVGGQSSGGVSILPATTAASTISPPYFPPNTEFVVVALNADGSLDATFGDGGRAVIDIAPDDQQTTSISTQELAILADGRVVIGGSVSATSFYVFNPAADAIVPPFTSQQQYAAVRLTATGQLDASYDSDGIATVTARTPLSEFFSSMAVTADGRVTAFATHSANSSAATVTAYRFDATGRPDATFDTDGYAEFVVDRLATTPPPGDTASISAGGGWSAIQSDGSIVFATTVYRSTYQAEPFRSTSRNDLSIFRISNSGALDTSFGTNGFLTRTQSSYDSNEPVSPESSSLVALQVFADDGIGLLESNSLSTPTRFQTTTNLVQFDEDGRPLLNADLGNSFTFPTSATRGETLQPRRVFFDSQGRLIAAGTSDTSVVTGTRLGVAQLIPTNLPQNAVEQTVFVSPGNGEVIAVRVDGVNPAVIGTPSKPFAEFTGTVVTELADLDGDGLLDRVNAVGSASSMRSIVEATILFSDGSLQRFDVTAFEDGYRGGVRITTADLDGDGAAEVIVTAADGGGGRVQIYSAPRTGFVKRADFLGIDDGIFRGGATTTVADLDGDGVPELFVAAGQGGGPRVAVFAGATLFTGEGGAAPPKLMGDFFAFGGDDLERMRNGVSLTAADLNADGRADLVFGAGPGGSRRILAVDGREFLAGNMVSLVNFFVDNNDQSRDGVQVTVRDINQDDRPDLVVENGSQLRFYDGARLAVAHGEEPGILRDVTVFPNDDLHIFVG